MKDQLRKIFDDTCLGSPSPKLDQDIKLSLTVVLMFIIVTVVDNGVTVGEVV